MKNIKLGKSNIDVSEIALGAMRINSLSINETEKLLKTAMDLGINFFDHADIYGGGECEEIFSNALQYNDDSREKMIIQSKCAIRPGVCYDFSKEYIINSVEGSLKRLKTDYLDFLLLHRPDALMEPEEVAEAFDFLQSTGKVRNFGVSNHTPYQIELLKKYVKQHINANQIQFGLGHGELVSQGMAMNTKFDDAISRDNGVLDYCRLNDITIQTWSPIFKTYTKSQQEALNCNSIELIFNNKNLVELNKKLNELSEKYNCTPSALAIAWILRHPAKMQSIVGTTNASRLEEYCIASNINLSREDWYALYMASGYVLP